MKILRLFPALLVFATSALAVDTTPPTLTITRTWIEKAGTRSNFNMLLDPQDETGLEVMDPLGTPGATGTIWFRSELINDPVPDTKAWKMMPWTRGQPFSLGFTCTKCVIEIRAKDAAGNFSPIQRRFFTAPFPYTSAPVTSIKLRDSISTNFPGPALDCRGLFAGEVDGVGLSGDIIQVDRTSGEVMVRRQTGYLFTNSNVLSLPANSIEDSAAADYDKDGRLDLVLVVNGALRLYHNDGLVSDVLTFTEVTIAPVALNGLGMTTINNACFGDLSGEGKPEIFVSGTDSGGAAHVGWLHHNAVNVFGSANNILAPTGASAGKVAVGDVTGDGRLDLVMIDAAVMQVILFKNDDNARLVGDDDVDTAKRPASTAISDGRPDIRAKSLAVGDVTGDGRADAVVIMSWWGSSNPLDRDDNHNFQYWQLLDSLGDTGLRAQPMQKVSASPFSATEEIFASDVIIKDLNGDRFPEVIMTSQFEADIADDPDTTVARGPGVRALQFFPHLDSQNRLSQLDYQTVVRVRIVSLSNPHRLVTAPYSGSKLADIWVACNSANTPFGWVSNSSGSGTTAALAVLGGASTQNDPNGSDGPNGTVTYFVYPGNSVDYQLTYINNTTSTLTNATMDCVLPNNVTVETQDGASLITAKTTQTLRWTLATIGAGETGTKNFRVRVLVTSKTGLLRPKNLIKAGTKTASSYMPNVTIDEPIDFDLVGVETTSDPFDPMHPGATTGQFVHFAEFITYKMKVTNRGTLTITDTKISMDMPKNTLFSGPVSNYPAGTIYLLNSGSKHLDIIVDSLASNEEKEVFVNVEVRAESGSIINNTLTALRPSGTSRKLPPIVTPVLPPPWHHSGSQQRYSQPRRKHRVHPACKKLEHRYLHSR